jgi:hypothetical protein
VGPRHTAVLDDRAFVVQDKATGKILQNDTQHDFWLKVLPAKTFDLHANDPRLLYDPITQRWIAWVQGLNPENGYLAVSMTSDPTEPWRGVKMPMPPHNYGARIGFDKNGLYISVHNGSNDLKTAQTCYAIPMADVVAASGPNLAQMQAFPDLHIEAFPATELDPDKAPDGAAVLLNREFGNSAGKLYLYKITWSGKKATISDAQTIPLSRTYLSSALHEERRFPQAGVGERVDAAVAKREGVVGGQHHAGVGIGGAECHGPGVADGDLAKGVHRRHGHVEGNADLNRVGSVDDEGSGAGLVGADVDAAGTHYDPLVRRAELGRVAGVQGRAAGQEGNRLGRAAVVLEGAEQGVGIRQVARAGQEAAAVVAAEVVPDGETAS